MVSEETREVKVQRRMIRFRDVCSVYQPDIVFCMTKGDRTGLAYRLVQTYRSIILLFHPWIPVFDLLVLGVGIHGVEEEWKKDRTMTTDMCVQ
jgi:hypothetical protein